MIILTSIDAVNAGWSSKFAWDGWSRPGTRLATLRQTSHFVFTHWKWMPAMITHCKGQHSDKAPVSIIHFSSHKKIWEQQFDRKISLMIFRRNAFSWSSVFFLFINRVWDFQGCKRNVQKKLWTHKENYQDKLKVANFISSSWVSNLDCSRL